LKRPPVQRVTNGQAFDGGGKNGRGKKEALGS